MTHHLICICSTREKESLPIPSTTLPPKFAREIERLETFNSRLWRNPHVSIAELAKWGFLFFEKDDKVVCYFCKLVVGQWEEGDLPASDHFCFSKNCPLMTNRLTENIPINPLPTTRPIFSTYTKFLSNTSKVMNIISTGGGPRYFKFTSLMERLQSFRDKGWNETIRPRIGKMAEAGFWCQKDDYVYCFYCNGGLNMWSAQDCPIRQHQEYYPTCPMSKLPRKQTEEPEGRDLNLMTERELRLELIERREQTLCTVCKSTTICILFTKCQHFIVCAQCVKQLKNCPKCWAPIPYLIKGIL